MEVIRTVSRDSVDELLERLGAKLGIDSSTVIPFTDYTDMLTTLLSFVAGDQDKFLVAGHATPELAIIADRAELKIVEILGASPFVRHLEDILEAIDSEKAIVYMANPNLVTGSTHSLAHLDQIARVISKGTLILDEKFFDYYGITGLPLLEQYEHIVVIRSLTAGFGIGSDQSGYLVGSHRFVNRFREEFAWSRITTTMHSLVTTTLVNEDVANKRLTQVYDEALRIASELTQIGVQNRITSTDFLLLRVADPKAVGNQLAAFGAPVENLEGYPDLENYLRYRIQSPLSNDNFMAAFRKMPPEHYKMDNIDKRAIMFHRPEEKPLHSRNSLTVKSANTGNTKKEVLAAK
ncbi:MAG: aminotransferase class I/II-fold pyridoxal phosphate-dependent enzyme [candidate division Zixibacteria bacterium]|nr:aminotransferase class I/II-fold pyridoxal phosphate-dependent enzyme [candidate division Zixibacteria bacterium]